MTKADDDGVGDDDDDDGNFGTCQAEECLVMIEGFWFVSLLC